MEVIKGKGQFIQGQWLAEGSPFSAINPANGQTLWNGHAASSSHAQQAVEAAKSALSAWARKTFSERCQIALNFAKKVEEKREAFAKVIALETGKPLWEAHTEVNSVIAKVKLSIEAYEERTGEKHTSSDTVTASLRFKPQGVTVVLGAFNFPAHISNGHIVPALIAGNTVIFKSSELTPATAEMMISFWQEAGIPAGVINSVHGASDIAIALLNEKIQGVYFTGSFKTGQAIHQHFAGRPEVILALEMGGNNPLVLGETQKLSAAVYHTLLSSYMTAGQRCTCARRLIIPDNAMGDNFLNTLKNAAADIKTTHNTPDEQAFMGPVISAEHAKGHFHAQKKLIEKGAEEILPMRLLEENTGYLSAGIIDMHTVKNVPDEEIFAPLIQVYRYSHFDEAIEIANDTAYGLSAGLLSDSLDQYRQFFSEIEAGLINWNRPTTGASSRLPFGGIGQSGNHRPSAWYAADYCAYPVASQEQNHLALPETLLPGIGALND